ncbi:MAG TPA: 4'-phosphopantetheinyl transferase superfamily protein [Blastococcus sp.]|nr:4'-phosphopantetheinyl transferase superfamily protein [Blastococcus sp.]
MPAVDRSHDAAPPLVRGCCQVWWARPEDVRPEHDALLDEADLRRRARLRRAADRRRLTAAAALARLVLGAHAGCPPGRLRIDRSCSRCGAPHGKPRLAGVRDLHFSVSHSAGCVAVAVRRGAPVGVDVEEIVPWAATELVDVALLTLAAEERAHLLGAPAGARAAGFATYWTRKEAVVKATGAGLTAPLEEIVVSAPASPPRVLRWDGPGGAAPPTLHTLRPPVGYVAALALVDGPADVVEADGAPLLRAAAR